MRVGITGHQRLDDPSAWEWVEREMRVELDKLTPPIEAVTSLAIGADQLLARLALERDASVHAVLPFADVERTFEPADLPDFRELRAQSSVEVLNVAGSDEDAFLAAGKRVADLSEVLIAVWNGEPARGEGGTADVVEYATSRGIRTVQLDPIRRMVVSR